MGVITILIAEDSADDYLMLEYAFRRANFDARRMRVRDGMEARDYLAGEGDFGNRQASPLPSLILADLKMPRMNGLELLQWTRTQPVLKRIPFILLSASASPLDVTAAYESFANCYHVKPSRLEDLIELIKKMADYWFKASVGPEIPESNGDESESEQKVGS